MKFRRTPIATSLCSNGISNSNNKINSNNSNINSIQRYTHTRTHNTRVRVFCCLFTSIRICFVHSWLGCPGSGCQFHLNWTYRSFDFWQIEFQRNKCNYGDQKTVSSMLLHFDENSFRKVGGITCYVVACTLAVRIYACLLHKSIASFIIMLLLLLLFISIFFRCCGCCCFLMYPSFSFFCSMMVLLISFF